MKSAFLFQINLLELIFQSLSTIVPYKHMLLSKRAKYEQMIDMQRRRDSANDELHKKLKIINSKIEKLNSDRLSEIVASIDRHLRENPSQVERTHKVQ